MTQSHPQNESREREYRAFISYAHADMAHAKWLHKALETYSVPRRLRRSHPGLPRGLGPIFMDTVELSAAPDLGERVTQALAKSDYLIVLCSPDAAASKWVNLEVENFLSFAARERVICVSVEENTSGIGFPPPLLRSGADDTFVEPLAIGLLPNRRQAVTKVASNLLDLDYAELADREHARRVRNLTYGIAASTLGAGFAVALAIYALAQRNEAQIQRDIAEEESRTSNEIVEMLVGIFEVVNPTTESAYELKATTVLERGAQRVDRQLSDRPEIRGRLFSAIANAYYGMGLYEESRDLMEKAVPILGRRSHKALAEIKLGQIAFRRSEFDAASQRYANALSLIEAGVEQRDLLLGELFLNMGNVAFYQGNLDETLTHFESSRKYFARAHPGRHVDKARILGSLGNVHSSMVKYREAIAFYEQALAILADLKHEKHIFKAQIQGSLAAAHTELGDYALASDIVEQAVANIESIVGANHPDYASMLFIKGRNLVRAEKPADALDTLNEAVDVLTAAIGENAAIVGDVQVYSARALALSGDLERALAAHEEYVQIFRQHYSPALALAFDAGFRGVLHAIAGDVMVARELCASVVDMEVSPTMIENLDIECNYYLKRARL